MIFSIELISTPSGITKEEQDDVTLLRYNQYQDALKDNSAFLHRYMVTPVDVKDPSGRKVLATVTGDEGVFPTTADALARLRPVQGDGTDHYYFQGPVYETKWEETYSKSFSGDWGSSEERWDRVDNGSGYEQKEEVNCYPGKDLGACKGTDVKDLCELVGGMSPGDVVRIEADDGFYQEFPYSVIYNTEPALGPYVLTWYSVDAGESGATSGYTGPDYAPSRSVTHPVRDP